MDTTWPAEVAAGLAWAQQRISELGWQATGTPVLVRATAWSAVYAIPASDARLWFKASGGGTRYEAALTRALAQWAPGKVLAPLDVHAAHGWQLLPDGGTPLRQQAAGRDHRAWERFAARYAELQRAVSPHAREMLILGVPDHRPEVMPGHLAALLHDPAVAISAQARGALRALQGRYASACARLAGAGPAPTIQHDDLHSGNILPAPSGDRFFDWGDASVAHPFTSLLIALRTMAHTFGLPPGDRVVLRFRDAYLEPWGLGRDGPELAELAIWTGLAGRALAWRRALAAAGPADLSEYGYRIGGWAAELLEPSPAG